MWRKLSTLPVPYMRRSVLCGHTIFHVRVLKVMSLWYLQENEHVVDKALKKFSSVFKLVYAFPEWKHRGHTVFPTGTTLLLIL